jgi:hypothetical protein
MPKTLIFTKLDDEADEILDELGRRTGLADRDGGDRRIFELEAIDPSWPEHVRLENNPGG